MACIHFMFFFFFFNDTATTEIYTLSLHDALPICRRRAWHATARGCACSAKRRTPSPAPTQSTPTPGRDRKSTRLNSSHQIISYAVFCLKKKKKKTTKQHMLKTCPQRQHTPFC